MQKIKIFKSVFALILLLFSLTAFSQTLDSLAFKQVQQKVSKLQKELKNQKADFLKQQFEMSKNINDLQAEIASDKKELDSLGIQIVNSQNNAEQDIHSIRQTVNKNTLIAVVCITLILCILFWFVSRKQKSDKTDIIEQLNITKSSIEENSAKGFSKQEDLIKSLLLKEKFPPIPPPRELDHSLALKVADEIVNMQMNLAHMDNKIRGHRHLSIAVTNILDNFRANGYEITDLLNKPYDEDMNMDVTKVPDSSLKEGEEIIQRIIRPEIFFNNKIIQHAQVIVAFGV